MNNDNGITTGTDSRLETDFLLDQGSKKLFEEATLIIKESQFFSDGSENDQDLSSSAAWNEIEDIIAL
jgi:hypothetical protein